MKKNNKKVFFQAQFTAGQNENIFKNDTSFVFEMKKEEKSIHLSFKNNNKKSLLKPKTWLNRL